MATFSQVSLDFPTLNVSALGMNLCCATIKLKRVNVVLCVIGCVEMHYFEFDFRPLSGVFHRGLGVATLITVTPCNPDSQILIQSDKHLRSSSVHSANHCMFFLPSIVIHF